MSRLRELKISGEKLTVRTDNTNRYFTEVERRRMLSPDEEFEIGVKAQRGDEAAINTLIESNLRFVISVAKQYTNGEVSLDELVCQGNIGLIHAAKTFDPSRGFKFISYAVWHIRKEILYYFTNYHRSIRIPQNVVTSLSQIRLADQIIMQEEGRSGTALELQETLSRSGRDFTVDEIERYLSAEAKMSPLENSNVEETHSPINWLSSDSSANELIEKSDSQILIEQALSIVGSVEREVIIRRHALRGGEPQTFSTIAEHFERTGEWARNVYLKGLRKMKKRLGNRRGEFEVR